MERGSADAPLTNGLADNEHWVWGLFFFDRNDPYKNVDSASANAAVAGAFGANDWMNRFPCVPPGLWQMLGGCGCGFC